MDLNDKYEELSELVAGIEDLVNKIEDVTYIEQLNGIKEEVQAELDEVSEQLEEQQEAEDREMNIELERNRFSIITKDLEHCYICTKKGMKNISKDDLHELLEGKNRQVSMKYGLVIPICRKCHSLVTNDKTLQDKLHKVAQKEFKKHYKTENFIQIFGQSYL